jgi:hypothetical protein
MSMRIRMRINIYKPPKTQPYTNNLQEGLEHCLSSFYYLFFAKKDNKKASAQSPTQRGLPK